MQNQIGQKLSLATVCHLLSRRRLQCNHQKTIILPFEEKAVILVVFYGLDSRRR